MNREGPAPHLWPGGTVRAASPRRVRVGGSGWAEAVADLVRAADAGPAGNRLVTVDGFSGAGKSTLAAYLAGPLGAPVITLEEIYPGWDGLARTPALARRWIGDPLASGSAPRWRTWDWRRDAPGPWRRLDPAPVVVLEGCGAGAAALAPATSLAVWVDTPAEQREQRLRARPDWAGYAPFRARWREQELALAAAERSAERADVVLDNGHGSV